MHNDTFYGYHKNLQGDVTGIYDESQNTIVEYIYDTWGKLVSVTGSNTAVGNLNPIRYRSYYYDQETGWYYLQSRYYDPGVGRFINADAVFDAGAGLLLPNVFVYCANNPIGRVDPTGEYSVFNALKYAAKWWNSTNPNFPRVGENKDCTNFVSQCLNAGGWSRKINWFFYKKASLPWLLSVITCTYVIFKNAGQEYVATKSWLNVAGLRSYLKNKKHKTEKVYLTKDSFKKAVKNGTVKKGAVVFQYTKDGNGSWGPQHTVMIGDTDKVNGIAYYYAHSENRNANDRNSSVDVAKKLIEPNGEHKSKIYVINMQ